MSRTFARRLERVEIASLPDAPDKPLRIVRVIIGNDDEPVEAYERKRGLDGANVLHRMTPAELLAFDAERAA